MDQWERIIAETYRDRRACWRKLARAYMRGDITERELLDASETLVTISEANVALLKALRGTA